MHGEDAPSFRDTLYTISKDGRRKWVYPEPIKGALYRRRRIVAWLLVVLYCAMPWLSISGEQAVLLDIGNRRFTFFGTTFWATDTFLLFAVLSTLALCLFLFTALFGRLWCGWACPETVFLEFVFRPIEQLIEGRASVRRRRDAGSWTFDRYWRKGLKFLIYAFLAWFLASTALAYFIGREPLIDMMGSAPWGHTTPFIITLVWSSLLVFQFGWFREQFCTVLCPYARFQSVLLDSHSKIVAYDYGRGEPRGKKASGDCIDCGACVRVCPTGIDIRNGLQLECIHCAQCIDACHEIMLAVKKPVGLIRYASELSLAGQTASLVRGRSVLYMALLAIIAGAAAYYLVNRTDGEFKIVRGSKDAPYSALTDGRITNHLHLILSNRSKTDISFSVAVLSPASVELIAPMNPAKLGPGEMKELPLFFNFSQVLLSAGKLPTRLRITGTDGMDRTVDFVLLGPGT